MKILAGDIGGTHSRFVLTDGEERVERSYRNAEFPDLYQVVDQFLHDSEAHKATIRRMVLGLPAPVDRGIVNLTNIDWQVEASQLQGRFAVRDVLLVNDFQAAAVGALSSRPARQLNPGAQVVASGPAVVTGAGTGLGHAWISDVSHPSMPWATEGGHVDFAPQDAQQCELHAWLADRFNGHVSVERVLSGPGLEAIFEFLAGFSLQAAEVSRRAAQKETSAVESVSLFMRLFGAHVGNLALLFNPVAGIHLCGGVVGHLAEWFGDGFLSAFTDKGRMRARVQPIPLFLHDRQDLGLQGALQIALRELT